jgi:hypothetical protein
MIGTHSNFGQASVKVLETCRTKFMQEDVVKKGIPIEKFIYYAEVILIKLVHHCYYEMVINKSPQCFVNTAIDKILSSTKNDQDTPTIKIFTQELKSAEILKCVPKTIISHTLQHTELRHLDQIEDEEFTHTDHQQTPLPQGLVDALNTFYAPQASTSEFA